MTVLIQIIYNQISSKDHTPKAMTSTDLEMLAV